MSLNYHHLRYFREVAREGNLTRTAERLNISQSALSTQIRQLEDRLGHPLFDRVGRSLVLTEAGRIALDHADRIFMTGDDLVDALGRATSIDAPLRVGALSTLSRNFQMRFLAPLIASGDASLVLKSGRRDELHEALESLALDVVLTTEPPPVEETAFHARLIDRQPIALVGTAQWVEGRDIAGILRDVPLIVPSDPAVQAGLSALSARVGRTPKIAAHVDDMAMVRLLTRQGLGVAVVPPVVLADEIASGQVIEAPHHLDMHEHFYAVTVARQFPHPMVERLVVEYGK